jgi:membrane protein YqaA with SNARE-associated domain
MIESMQEFASTFPPALQWLAVMLAAAIPFVESYFGAALGVVIGINPLIAILVAVVGNVASMLLLVNGAHFVRRRVAKEKEAPSQKYLKLRTAFDKYGIAGVSLLGQTILPSQITSAALVSFGAAKEKVIF